MRQNPHPHTTFYQYLTMISFAHKITVLFHFLLYFFFSYTLINNSTLSLSIDTSGTVTFDKSCCCIHGPKISE